MNTKPENRFKKPEKQYTADEVLKAAKSGGVSASLNDSDIKVINSNPNAGMELVNYKVNYMNAPTGEAGDYARGIARAGAEFVRRQYGGYTTNADGSIATAAAPDKATGLGKVQKVSKSGNNDLYKGYEKALLDAQAKAQENVYGMVAASTGGNASSSAVTKAAAAGADFSQLLAEKKAEFENQEYNRNLKEAELAASLGDFSKLRAMGIDTSSYEAELATQKARTERETALNEAYAAAELGDYSKLAALGFDTSYIESIKGDDAAQKKLSEAITLATSLGIYGPLEALGYDTTWLKGKQGDGTEPKLDLNSALALKEAGYSSPDIESALKYWLGEGYTYTAPVVNLPGTGGAPVIDDGNPYDFSTTFEQLKAAGATDYDSALRLLKGTGDKNAEAIAELFAAQISGTEPKGVLGKITQPLVKGAAAVGDFVSKASIRSKVAQMQSEGKSNEDIYQYFVGQAMANGMDVDTLYDVLSELGIGG